METAKIGIVAWLGLVPWEMRYAPRFLLKPAIW